MPALQKARTATIADGGLLYISACLPAQQRETRVVKDMAVDAIAEELVEWVGAK
jgi:hypothetical protein